MKTHLTQNKLPHMPERPHPVWSDVIDAVTARIVSEHDAKDAIQDILERREYCDCWHGGHTGEHPGDCQYTTDCPSSCSLVVLARLHGLEPTPDRRISQATEPAED